VTIHFPRTSTSLWKPGVHPPHSPTPVISMSKCRTISDNSERLASKQNIHKHQLCSVTMAKH